MTKEGTAKTVLAITIAILILTLVLSVLSMYPVATGKTQTSTIINSQFKLCPNEIYREGLGEFHGNEKLTLIVDSQNIFQKNFSLITYSGLRYFNSSTTNISHSFLAGADYYEAVFASNSSSANWINFQVIVQKPQNIYPLGWLAEIAKIMFTATIVATILIILKLYKSSLTKTIPTNHVSQKLNKTSRNWLIAFLAISLVLWISLLAVNTNGLATFENWYTDHARHSYVSSLFIKDGLAIFQAPLGDLASQDSSRFMFVTWPEMPHLYPLGSMLIFLPFGALLQGGFNADLVYKFEIALFLVFAHICLYLFLKVFLKKDLQLSLKALGVYIAYVSLVIYAADGMYDSVAFLFALFAVGLFLAERYDGFFLLMGFSVFLKYQAGIFLLPLILVSFIKLYEKRGPKLLLRNKAVLGGAAFGLISFFTATLSLPILMHTRGEFIMNGINAFSPNAQVPWSLQAFSVVLTLAVTLVYAFYMLNKSSLLSLSSIFLLVPSFILPYFQNWYLPFILVYILFPQQKTELKATLAWLVFMIVMLSFGGTSFNPVQIIDNFRTMFKI